jgi:CRISPR-associated protein (TIGR02584 family)
MRRRILIITAGETPQLVTETAYALISAPEPWVPDQLLLATTTSGKNLFETGQGRYPMPVLISPDRSSGKLVSLFAQFGFDPPGVGYILPSDGDKLHDDIRSPEQVEAFADAMFRSLVELTADPDSEIHLSIAGGRKTMSFIAGQVMSLCARHQDRMSHCLVSPPELEASRDFWWPNEEGTTLSARVDLHEINFLKLAPHLKVHRVFPEHAGWAEGVRLANDALAADELTLDFNTGAIRVGETCVTVGKGREFAVMALVAVAKKLGWTAKGDRLEDDREKFWRTFARCMGLLQLEQIYEGEPSYVRVNRNRLDSKVEALTREGLLYASGDDLWAQHWGDFWQSPKSRLKNKLKRVFAESVWPLILPDPPGRTKAWTTAFEREKIRIVLPEDLTLDYFVDA